LRNFSTNLVSGRPMNGKKPVEGGFGIRPGNESSNDNPLFGAYNPNSYASSNYGGGSYVENPMQLAAQRQKQSSGGGVMPSNDTSHDNPLSTHSPQMLEYFKQMNAQIVAQNPIKKRGRGGAQTSGYGNGGGKGVAFNL